MEWVKYIPLIILLNLTLASWSYGLEVLVGGGATYSQLQVVNGTSAGDSYFRGLSYLVCPRLRFNSKGKSSKNGYRLDLVGIYKKDSLQNTSAGSNESNQATSYGAGLEVLFSRFFIGIQYLIVSSEITSGELSSPLNYGSFGPLGGINLFFSNRLSLQVGVSTLSGKADSPSDSNSSRAPINISGFVTILFLLF